MENLAKVGACASTACSFNNDGCSAFAVTMGDKGCVTFVEIGKRGGLDTVAAHVGACKRDDCTYNHNLVCEAEAVRIGAGSAECLTFTAA